MPAPARCPIDRRPVAAIVVSAVGWCAVAGCAPPAWKGGFDSGNPAARMYAIEDAARTLDSSAVEPLIESLRADDPAVRYMAIETLERLTGTTMGYRFYDPWYLREAAIQRWVDEARARGWVSDAPLPPTRDQVDTGEFG